MDVYEKWVRIFSEFASVDSAECITFAIDNIVAILDFYPETDSGEWKYQVDDLWFTYLGPAEKVILGLTST